MVNLQVMSLVIREDGVTFTAQDGQRYFQPNLPYRYVKRDRAKMPSLRAIERYHDVTPGTCIRCGELCRAERAHIIDRQFGGPDTVENIVPLCVLCHRRGGMDDDERMPPFVPGEEWKAWLWLETDCWWDYMDAVSKFMWEYPVAAGAIPLPMELPLPTRSEVEEHMREYIASRRGRA